MRLRKAGYLRSSIFDSYFPVLAFNGQEGLSVCYPDGIQAEKGVIQLIYDFDRKDEKKILMAIFPEEDVLAGMPVSDVWRTRVLVNPTALNVVRERLSKPGKHK